MSESLSLTSRNVVGNRLSKEGGKSAKILEIHDGIKYRSSEIFLGRGGSLEISSRGCRFDQLRRILRVSPHKDVTREPARQVSKECTNGKIVGRSKVATLQIEGGILQTGFWRGRRYSKELHLRR